MSGPTSSLNLRRIFARAGAGKDRRDRELVAAIRDARSQFSGSSDSELTERSSALTHPAMEAGGLAAALSDRILVPTFALVLEAAARTLGVELYDVQVLAGVSLARGKVAEMQTGEGKTFAALLPANLHALSGAGVHVMTVNAYLAKRDFEQLAPVYRLLGRTVGLVQAGMDPDAKRAAYQCDVTYGPGYEFGFDYLRDQIARISRGQPQLGERFRDRLRGKNDRHPQPMQRNHHVAIVDEADSVLIDEATTPLVLAAGGSQPASNAEVYQAAMRIAAELQPDEHFLNREQHGSTQLTQLGLQHVTEIAPPIADSRLDRPWAVYIEQALRAQLHFRCDDHYVVRDNQVHIVDQHTGRIFQDRSWCDGLHQAVQAKEGLPITAETNSVARITRQRYFRLYRQVCGMTGTAQGSEPELRDIYGLKVVIIPPHRPCLRRRPSPRVFCDQASKEEAIVETIVKAHTTGQPVLVGTSSIEASQRLSERLEEHRIQHQLLNGKQDAEEAEIVARAGRLGVVTIATNMAGRGTDIRIEPAAAALGGLFVVATEPQDCRRVDRQLAGRAARQGNPGVCQLFAAADDRLFSDHAPRLAEKIRRRVGSRAEFPDDLGEQIAAVQKKVERRKKEHRRQILDQDDWLENVMRDLAPSL